MGALSAALLVIALAGCGHDGGGAVVASPGQTTGAGQPAQPTKDPAGSGSHSGSGSGDGAPKAIIDPNETPGDERTVALKDHFLVPDVRGLDLQDAQDLFQGRNSYEMEQVDATGRDRRLSVDGNWKVCRQSPKPGLDVPMDTKVRLFAVHNGERCP
jgi:PASTA domain-containing protein